MRELRHNDPSLFKGYVYRHNLQNAPRLHADGHTLNANNNKTREKKSRGTSILYFTDIPEQTQCATVCYIVNFGNCGFSFLRYNKQYFIINKFFS